MYVGGAWDVMALYICGGKRQLEKVGSFLPCYTGPEMELTWSGLTASTVMETSVQFPLQSAMLPCQLLYCVFFFFPILN